MRSRVSTVVVALVALSLAWAPGALSARRKAPASVVVGTDPSGDFGSNIAPPGAGAGGAAGLDLVSATIASKDSETLTFTIAVESGIDEFAATRAGVYMWGFAVDGEGWTLYGPCKSRVGDGCEPQGLDLTFQLIPDAGAAETVLGVVDSTANTVSFDIPLDLLRAGPGSVVKGNAPDLNHPAPVVVARPAAEVVPEAGESATPNDELSVTGRFVVPRR